MTQSPTNVNTPVLLQVTTRPKGSSLADYADQLAQALLDAALAREPERCRYHKLVLQCPHYSERFDRATGEVKLIQCDQRSKGKPANPTLLMYAINKLEQQRNNIDHNAIAAYIVEKFLAINNIPDPIERAEQFAAAMREMPYAV